MPFSLLASQVPEPIVASGIFPPGSPPIVSVPLVQGDKEELIDKFNNLALSLDLSGRYGGGAYAVATGLELTAGAGLVLNVAAGTAMIDCPVTIPSATTLTLLDAHTGASPNGCYIYLQQTGVLLVVYDTLTPPGVPCV